MQWQTKAASAWHVMMSSGIESALVSPYPIGQLIVLHACCCLCDRGLWPFAPCLGPFTPLACLRTHVLMQIGLGWPLEDFASEATAALDAGLVDQSAVQRLAQSRQAQMPATLA